MSLHVPRGSTLEDLRDSLREVISEDDIRDVDSALADGRWADMVSALRVHGIVADDETLLALPFLVEIDDDVEAPLAGRQ